MAPSEFDVQGHAGESRIDRRQSTRQMFYDELWLKDNGAAPLLGEARAAEIGGKCTISPSDAAGTRVLALLPLDAS